MNKENKSIALSLIMFVLFIDLLGFISWKLTDQRPPDNFHAGIITESIIRD